MAASLIFRSGAVRLLPAHFSHAVSLVLTLVRRDFFDKALLFVYGATAFSFLGAGLKPIASRTIFAESFG